MSNAERRSFEISDTKEFVYYRDEGVCRTCGSLVEYPGHAAHHVPKTKPNLKMWGPQVINHPDNLALTCPNQNCNDAQMIGAHTVDGASLLAEIRRQLQTET